MLRMMMDCIPAGAEGDEIRAGLLAQYEQVTAPIRKGGGLTYNLTYDEPCLDANGIPTKDAAGAWQTTSVSGVYTENHFDMTPLINAYRTYVRMLAPGQPRNDLNAAWVKLIGTQQRLLPIHILQRYCDPDVRFDALPSFEGVFNRTTQFRDNSLPGRGVEKELLSSSLSENFALFRTGLERLSYSGLTTASGRTTAVCSGAREVWDSDSVKVDLQAVSHIDRVSKDAIRTIEQLLANQVQSHTQFRR